MMFISYSYTIACTQNDGAATIRSICSTLLNVPLIILLRKVW